MLRSVKHVGQYLWGSWLLLLLQQNLQASVTSVRSCPSTETGKKIHLQQDNEATRDQLASSPSVTTQGSYKVAVEKL